MAKITRLTPASSRADTLFPCIYYLSLSSILQVVVWWLSQGTASMFATRVVLRTAQFEVIVRAL
ncbi:hypothetical protein BDZ94DRAFT_1258697 [Collybia nuda]|uniref:Uncharacterized protein n=1 Tax=Collybia nuda TaxID=64659 RepID=A0A9P6CKB6_9AGAR|nr:hypothetical protein BDZ94DRAFT_1258697 [Collybia nuda]